VKACVNRSKHFPSMKSPPFVDDFASRGIN
jgi:hypothetical protein